MTSLKGTRNTSRYSQSNGERTSGTGRKRTNNHNVVIINKIRQLHKDQPKMADVDGLMKLFTMSRKDIESIIKNS